MALAPLTPDSGTDSGSRLRSDPRLRAAARVLGDLRARPWVRILLAVLATRAVLTAIAVQTSATFAGIRPITAPRCWTMRSSLTGSRVLQLWGNWDSEWYVRLAGHGWPGRPKPNLRPWAFQPLYPTSLRGLGTLLGGRTFLAGLIISTACLVVSCELVRRLALLDLDEVAAWRAVWFFLALPGSFLFSAVLTESMFTMLALGAFLAARRGRWALACALVGLAGVTRSVGLLIVVPVAVEYLLAHGATWRRPVPRSAWHPRLATFMLAPAGLAVWSLYAWRRTGNPLIWKDVQFTQWPHEQTTPWGLLADGVRGVLTDPFGFRSLAVAVTTGVLLAAVVGTATGRMRLSSGLYLLILAVPPLMIGDVVWHGMVRYLAPCFPVALLLARTQRQQVSTAVLVCLALVQGMAITLWTTCGTGIVI